MALGTTMLAIALVDRFLRIALGGSWQLGEPGLRDESADDELYLTGIFLFVLFLLLGTGVWIGLALLGVAWVGMTLFTNSPAGDAMITTIWTASSSWALTALPLFIWTGEILFRTRLSEDMFRGLSPWLANWPGRLLHTNIVGCTVFAAVSGSSAATVVTIGKMSIPSCAGAAIRSG